MIKRSFFGLLQPKLRYDTPGGADPEAKTVKPSAEIRLLIPDGATPPASTLLKTGDAVGAEQKLMLSENAPAYAVAPVSGTISGIEPFVGDFGYRATALTIKPDGAGERDTELAEALQTPSAAVIRSFLATVPGGSIPPSVVGEAASGDAPVHTLVIMGMDADLLVTTRQYVLKTDIKAVKNGVRILKEHATVEKIVIAVPDTLAQDAMTTGAEVKLISSDYPSALPHMVANSISGDAVPAGKSIAEAGFAFISVEAVASIGKAFDSNKLPDEKRITVIDKTGRKTIVSTIVGTPIQDILKALGLAVGEMDRIISGGPMTGTAVPTPQYPVQPDTDAIILQDKAQIPLVTDNYCINCGECVRICPAGIPVNLLVRYLEAGQYDDAEDGQDLNACIGCGLCSYVCTARIPIFQYIRLAKYELARHQTAEADNV